MGVRVSLGYHRLFNIGGWTTGSSLIALGLNVWQCMLTVIVGNILVGLFCVLSGAPGAKWHIPFPIILKAPWGLRGYLFVVVQRLFLAMIWFSTQVYWGGTRLKFIFYSILLTNALILLLLYKIILYSRYYNRNRA